MIGFDNRFGCATVSLGPSNKPHKTLILRIRGDKMKVKSIDPESPSYFKDLAKRVLGKAYVEDEFCQQCWEIRALTGSFRNCPIHTVNLIPVDLEPEMEDW